MPAPDDPARNRARALLRVRQPERLRAVALAAALLIGGRVVAAGQTPDDRDDTPRQPTWTLASGAGVSLVPAGDVFPAYVADPHHPTNALLFRFYASKEIPATTTRRTELSGGGRFGMLRVDTAGGAGDRGRSFQVSLDAGLDALFDSAYSDDVVGWDGHYGLTFTTADRGPWAFKLALLHTSAHVGDEYAQRMHHTRIDYTREEVAIGASWRSGPRWRIYGETGIAYMMKIAVQERWRAQTGVEYESRPVWGDRFAWYGAADVSAMQERDWRVDRTLQGGVVARSHGHTYRMMGEYSKGRPPVAEFFTATESSVTIGLRIEF